MHVHAHVYLYTYTYIKWMKIAFIIAHKRNNVLFLFGTLKVQSLIHMLKEKKAVSPDHQNPQPSIYKTNVLCTPIRSTCILRFSRSWFFQLFRCLSYTWAHIKYPSSLCVCTCVYKHTPTHHPKTRKVREIYKTDPLSLPLPKHSPPRQEQALTMNKLEKNPTSNPLPPTHEGI